MKYYKVTYDIECLNGTLSEQQYGKWCKAGPFKSKSAAEKFILELPLNHKVFRAQAYEINKYSID